MFFQLLISSIFHYCFIKLQCTLTLFLLDEIAFLITEELFFTFGAKTSAYACWTLPINRPFRANTTLITSLSLREPNSLSGSFKHEFDVNSLFHFVQGSILELLQVTPPAEKLAVIELRLPQL